MPMRIKDYNELSEHIPTDVFDMNIRMFSSCENTDGNTYNTWDNDQYDRY